GTFAATFVAAAVPDRPLAVFFAVFMGFVAWKMARDAAPSPSRGLPSTPGLAGAGAGIGAVSALVAIGGGSLTVPFLAWCNVRLQGAMGTPAAVGLPAGLTGALGYIVNGVGVDGLPAATLGFVSWPAALALAAGSILTAPQGARLAHRLPVAALKRLFAVLLVSLSLHMVWTLFK